MVSSHNEQVSCSVQDALFFVWFLSLCICGLCPVLRFLGFFLFSFCLWYPAALSALVFLGFYFMCYITVAALHKLADSFFLFFFFFIFPDLYFVNYFHGNISLNASRKVGFTLHSDLLQVLLYIHKYAQHSWSGCISSNTCPRFTRQDQVEHSTHCSASWSLAWLLMRSDWLKRDISLFISKLCSKMNEFR